MYPRVCVAEIPIYGTDEKPFEKRWAKHIGNVAQEMVKCGWKKEDAEKQHRESMHPRTIWKYAQIIGFLKIELSPSNVWFEAYAPLGERYCYNQTRKTFPQNWHMNGTHFYVDDNIGNDEIRAEIYEWIREINVSHLRHRYLDLTVFDVVSTYIDFRKILDEL